MVFNAALKLYTFWHALFTRTQVNFSRPKYSHFLSISLLILQLLTKKNFQNQLQGRPNGYSLPSPCACRDSENHTQTPPSPEITDQSQLQLTTSTFPIYLDKKRQPYLSYEHDAKTLSNFGCAQTTCQTGPSWPLNSANGYVCPDGFSWNT